VVVVVVFMVRFIVVIVSMPGVIIVSTKEKGWLAFTIFHLGTPSNVGLVYEKLIPLTVWVVSAVGIELIYPLTSLLSIFVPETP
jgi:uncharacterized membrane protein YGL010W